MDQLIGVGLQHFVPVILALGCAAKDAFPVFPSVGNPFIANVALRIVKAGHRIHAVGVLAAILSPLIVRPIENTEEYEVVSGHRRLHAAQKAGITEVPALIYALDRDAAAIAVVDSNLHREHILPSEKAFAYKLKADALKHQGQRTDITSEQIAPKLSTEVIGEQEGISKDSRIASHKSVFMLCVFKKRTA